MEHALLLLFITCTLLYILPLRQTLRIMLTKPYKLMTKNDTTVALPMQTKIKTEQRPSRFDQGPMGGFSNGQNRGPSQGGAEGSGSQAAARGGPGAPGVLGSAPGNQGGGPGNQGGRGPNQGGRGPNQGGRGPNQGQGPTQGGPGGAAYGSRGPQRPPMDEARGRMPVERREADRSDRGRMDRRDDFMSKRMRRF